MVVIVKIYFGKNFKFYGVLKDRVKMIIVSFDFVFF